MGVAVNGGTASRGATSRSGREGRGANGLAAIRVGAARVRLAAMVLVLLALPAAAKAERYALIVSGASGGPEYAEQYAGWTKALVQVLVDRMKFDRERITVLTDSPAEGARSSSANVRKALASVRETMAADDLLFVVLIGHGTFDGVDAKFNLVGPDLESGDWFALLDGLPGQLVLVNTTAASFPFIERLAADRRIVITATDSVAQQFDTVFPEYFISAFGDEGADIDKNGRVSIWEAFAAATGAVRRHYLQRGQLPTERALLDDNGDGLGRDATAAAREVGSGDQAVSDDGARASRTYLDEPLPGAPPTDDVLVRLLQTRAAVEAEVEELRLRRTFIPPDQYEKEFERLMIELARVSREIRNRIKS